MGKKFGKEWELDVSSPAEALRMIEANKPGLKGWIITNREKYDAYKVVCIYDDGREEALNDDTYVATRSKIKSIRFTPTVAGAGGIGKVIVGAILIAASFIPGNPFSTVMFNVGASMVLGGVIELLTAQPRKKDSVDEGASSYYFDGPANTEQQGNPIPLIYGRVLVGSHPISASISIDEIAAT